MPIFEYRCAACGHEFEELVVSEKDTIICPKCGAAEVTRKLSSFACSGSSGSSSCAAPSGSGFR